MLRKDSELSLAVRRRRVTFACSPRPCGGNARDGGGAYGKVSIERLCLSPYVEKHLNSKVIPELRSRRCFSCFGIPMLYMCVRDIMNVLRTGMNMYISHIHVWLCYPIYQPLRSGRI